MKIGKHTVTKKEILKVIGIAVLLCLCVFGAVKVNSYRKAQGRGFPDSYLPASAIRLIHLSFIKIKSMWRPMEIVFLVICPVKF